MLGTVLVMLATSMLPGWALASVLDGSSDRLRKGLLAPSLGLLLLYGMSGTLLLLKVWSIGLMWVAVVALNLVAYRTVTIRNEVVAQRSHWQRLEAAMHGEVAESAANTTLSKEAETQLRFQRQRNLPLMGIGFVIALTALLSPTLQTLPFGVDWIGFAVLTQQVVLQGELVLSGTNVGFWTYPPAYPSLSAWLAATLNLDAGVAVFRLGHWSLFTVLIGLMGALDRHGAGAQAMLAMGLGLGLFAKTFDSGYPSVASQLGMVVGVLTLFRPTDQRQRYHTVGVGLALWCVALIHPTGAIYLGLLLLSHVLHGVNMENETQRVWARNVAYLASIFITIGFTVALLVVAPRLFEEAVFSEYGWQGGRPLLVYNGPVLAVACFAAIVLRQTLEGRIATTWFALLWLLSLVHIVEGLQHVPVLSLLSYTLYSMALHAFHVPLAVLVALWWSPSTTLTPKFQANETPWKPMPQAVAWSLTGMVLLGTLVAATVAVQLSHHDELLAVSPGDLALRDALEAIDGSVYTENMHWGYVWNAPAGLETTSIPTLGLVHLTQSEQSAATRAVYTDNISYFVEKNMRHALTSPLGTVQWTLTTSPFWEPMVQVDGATLWELRPEGDATTPVLIGIDEGDCSDCTARLDPWRDHKFRDPLNLGQERPFLLEGKTASLEIEVPEGAVEMCLVYEIIGSTDAVYVNASSGFDRPFHALQASAGYHQSCFALNTSSTVDALTFTWKSEESSRWVNPLGLSGRDTVLFDRTGIKFQWLEWRSGDVEQIP